MSRDCPSRNRRGCQSTNFDEGIQESTRIEWYSPWRGWADSPAARPDPGLAHKIGEQRGLFRPGAPHWVATGSIPPIANLVEAPLQQHCKTCLPAMVLTVSKEASNASATVRLLLSIW